MKDALAAQEKRASDTYDRDRKDRDRKDRGRGRRGGFHNSEDYRSRRSHRAGFDDAAGDVGSWNTYNGRYVPPSVPLWFDGKYVSLGLWEILTYIPKCSISFA